MLHILAFIGFLILWGMGNIVRVLISDFLGILKNCSGWWLADRPTAVALLYYAYTIIQQFDIFSFFSFQSRRPSDCLSWMLHRLGTSTSCPTMAFRAAGMQALCKICDLWRCS